MENENLEAGTPTNPESEETLETPTEGADETPKTLSDEEVAELKKKADLAEAYKVRAEKAESKLKTTKPSGKKEEVSVDFSPKDYLALSQEKISVDDFDEVVRVSKILGKTISETLKDKTMKSILAERIEERRTADATNTKASARGGKKNTGEALLNQMANNEVPEEEEDIDKLTSARWEAKLKK